MSHIEIDDGLYERIAKIAQARSYPTTGEREIEKAVALYLATWEQFFFGGPLLALAQASPKGDRT